MHRSDARTPCHRPQRVPVAVHQQRQHTSAATAQLRCFGGGDSGGSPTRSFPGRGEAILRRRALRFGEFGHRPLPWQVPDDQRGLHSRQCNAEYYPRKPHTADQLSGGLRGEVTV
jgi:hypothetical protein